MNDWPEDLRADLDASFRANPFLATMGIALDDWGPGWAVTRMRPGPEVQNLVGTVHGGAISSLADAAFEVACNGYGREAVALELTCHFSAAATGGELIARAEEISRSRRTASYRITVTQDEVVIATLLALAYRTERWRLGAERYPAAWRAHH